jgi:hypothetical protein
MMSSSLKKLWLGDCSLPTAFWLHFYAGSAVVSFVGIMLFALPLKALHQLGLGWMLSIGLVTAYWAVAAIGVWRSAGTYGGRRIWAVLARVIACLQVLTGIRLLLWGGIMLLTGQIANAN